jgi:hypothetical protein
MPMNRGGYGQPEIQDISRQRKFAEQLRAQGAEDLKGQMVSGHYVAPSWTQQLAKVLQSGLGGYMENKADTQEKDYNATKSRKFAEILSGNKPQQVAGQPIVNTTMPAYEPEQQDRFGSPLPNAQRQPVTTETPTMTQESPEDMQARQQEAVLGYMQQYGNTPEGQYLLSRMDKQDDRAYAKGEKIDDRQYADTREEKLYNRNRQDKLSDVDAERKYQDIVRADQQGHQVSLQDRQFAQQFQMQAQSQNFAVGQQSRSQQFSASENEKARNQQMEIAGLKSSGASGAAGIAAQVKVNDAKDVLSILDQASPLVKTATSSGLGNVMDNSAAFFGQSTSGADAAAKLKALEGNLVSKMPKMSGPQSDKDVLMYKQMAGRIGDPTVPVSQKQAAIEAIKEINSRYAGVPYQPNNLMPKNEMMPAASQDSEAVMWAKSNLNDPRAAAILKANGVR